MTLITKPDFTYVWASGGAVVAPNDTKKQQGWVAEAPPFQYDNWLQNRQDQMLAHINQRGIPAWDALTNYEAGGLSYVQGSDGKIYKSVAASGPVSVVSNPTTDLTDTYWTVAFLTQAAGDDRYTQRSNNLSDLTNVATARTNIGVVPATETTAGLLEIATALEAQSFTANKAIDGAKLSEAFRGSNSLLAANGYQKLPSGLIIQWGISSTETSTVTVTLPISYTTENLIAGTFPFKNPADTFNIAPVVSKTNSQFTFNKYNQAGSLSNPGTVQWFSIGY